MALSRLKTWISEVLTAADLNAEFDNILDNALALISPLTGALDADGKEIILDADADTSITADTDDQIDFRVGGSDKLKMIATGITAQGIDFVEAEGAAVASATTTDIWAGDGNTLHITGTTTITSFGTAPQAGAWKKVIFDGALTLTHGANLSLPGSANITTAADDVAFVYADTTTQFDVLYFKKDGKAITPAGKAPTVQVFTSSGTWTKPAGLVAVKVKIVGGGGGGGGVDNTAGSKSCGGGGGGYTEKVIAAASLGATETVTIGAGGAGGSSAPAAGSNGGLTSFGTYVSVGGSSNGGATGTGGTANTVKTSGGTINTAGDFSVVGGDGQSGREGGSGGNSLLGIGGVPDQGNQGSVGKGYGAGGSGAVSTGTAVPGGEGTAGICIVEEYY